MERRSEIYLERMGGLQPVPDEAVIQAGSTVRRQISRNFRHTVVNGRMVHLFWFVLTSVVLLFVVSPILAIFTLEHLSGQSFLIIQQELPARWFWLLSLTVFFYMILERLREGARWLLRNFASPPHGKSVAVFDKDNAPQWSEVAADVIEHCANKKIAEKIKEFTVEKETPFRVLTKFLPVPIWEYRRPEAFSRNGLSDREKKKRGKKLFEVDSICGGVLFLLGVRPQPRFEESGEGYVEKVAHDIYWRADVQEVPDADQADIHLRFHQSTIERQFRIACRYKTFAALNNYRLTPILLLAVKDVVDCLTDARGEYGRDHDSIYQNLKHVRPDNVISLLAEDAYYRFPPRMERILAKKYDPLPGQLLFKGEGGDWIMMFDPARVWVVQPNDQAHIEALAALRSAIHLASRNKTVGVFLKKRDLLVVDNRRVLVGRQEDSPNLSYHDTVAGWFPSLAGRWLRKIYGFPQAGEPGNFQEAVIEDKPMELGGDTTVPNIPSALINMRCGDELF